MPPSRRALRPQASPQLVQYVFAARQRGMSDAAIRASLVAGGWKPALVQQALAAAGPAPVFRPMAPAAPPPPSSSNATTLLLLAALVGFAAWHFRSAPKPAFVPVTTTSDAPPDAAPASKYGHPPLDEEPPAAPPPPGTADDPYAAVPAAGALPGTEGGAAMPDGELPAEPPSAKPVCRTPGGPSFQKGAPPGFPSALLSLPGAEVQGHIRKGAVETVYLCVAATEERIRAQLTALYPEWEVAEAPAAAAGALPGFEAPAGPTKLTATAADSAPVTITLKAVPDGTSVTLRRDTR